MNLGGVASRAGAGFLGGAATIAALTLLSRLAGLGRVVVFSQTVGANCLGDAYTAANTLPNIVFEIVAGGVLASAVVPLLASDVVGTDEDRARARRTASALLTWTVVALVPVALLVIVLARPIAGLSLGDAAQHRCPDSVGVVVTMLRVFAPQIVFYGIGIVLTGILHAHGRFAGPAIAPLLSSGVVIAAYLIFAAGSVPTGANELRLVSATSQLILSVGTTIGVVVLTLPLFWWLRPEGLRLRPRLRLDAGIARRAMRLGAAGLAMLVGQQAAVFVALRLALDHTPPGFNTIFLYAQTVFLLPWALFAVPTATAVFPRLAAAAGRREDAGYGQALSAALRVVVATALLGSAVLIATAPQIATVFLAHSTIPAPTLARGIVGFAPGLLGYGLFALLTRALYAVHRARIVTIVGAGGWLIVIIADLVIARALPATDRVMALAVGNSIGMTIAGACLVGAAAIRLPRASFGGVGRTAAASLVAAVAAGVGGVAVSGVVRGANRVASVGHGMLVAAVVVVIFVVVAAIAAPDDAKVLRASLAGALRRVRPR